MLDLSLGRLLQVRDMVLEAQVDEQRRQLANRQQELRIMATFVAAASGSRELMRDAEGITLLAPLDDDQPAGRPALKPVPLRALRAAFGPVG